MTELPHPTRTVCPTCLRKVPAVLSGPPDAVLLEGDCPEHGVWRTPVWNGTPSYDLWCAGADTTAADQVCTALVEVTQRCDLGCPVCFAEAGPRAEPDPPLSLLKDMLAGVFDSAGAVNLQLSGGEPTLREDLPQIAQMAADIGFTFIQLNTNGIRLGEETGYAEELRASGVDSVFLQFDGLDDRTYRVLRGRPLRETKLRTLERCAQAGLAVVLVPTIVPGVNDGEIGALVRFAASWPGVVRGLHFQPISYFGRHPFEDLRHLTMPEMLRMIEAQTEGEVRADDFAPSCCEHVRCSFRARYWVREGGRLERLQAARSCCSPRTEEPARRAVAATARQWSAGANTAPARVGSSNGATDGLTLFLQQAERSLTISGMLFQDAWNVDWERIDRCCVRVATPDHRLVSFCLWNLTGATGERLHPR